MVEFKSDFALLRVWDLSLPEMSPTWSAYTEKKIYSVIRGDIKSTNYTHTTHFPNGASKTLTCTIHKYQGLFYVDTNKRGKGDKYRYLELVKRGDRNNPLDNPAEFGVLPGQKDNGWPDIQPVGWKSDFSLHTAGSNDDGDFWDATWSHRFEQAVYRVYLNQHPGPIYYRFRPKARPGTEELCCLYKEGSNMIFDSARKDLGDNRLWIVIKSRNNNNEQEEDLQPQQLPPAKEPLQESKQAQPQSALLGSVKKVFNGFWNIFKSSKEDKKAEPDEDEKDSCVVCDAEARSHAVLPCMHYCLCSSCVDPIMKTGLCPMCRTPIESIKKLFS